MPLFKLILAYDGTAFEGWQSQARAGGARTIQATVEAALAKLARAERVAVVASGRTDTGVHALGQAISFELPRAISPFALQRALNAMLPGEIRVLAADEAPAGFNARKSALSKLYRYVLDTGPVQLPARRLYVGHVPFALDPAAVAEVAALYLGRHDFASLASSGGAAKTTVRAVLRSEAKWDGPALVYETEADGFLRKMVRSMVGGLIAAGRGATTAAALREALAARDRRVWPKPAEARGLTLVRVDYPPPVLP